MGEFTPIDLAAFDEELERGLHLIPVHMREGVKRYVLQGIPPGHFMQAVLKNDLFEAFARADDSNVRAMHNWVKFLYNFAPSGCYGSPSKYDDWLKRHHGKEN